MVHADPKGTVTFHNMSHTTDATLTFTTTTVFKVPSVTIKANGAPVTLDVMDLPSGVGETYTQYKINSCLAPPAPRRLGRGSDPNEVIVP